MIPSNYCYLTYVIKPGKKYVAIEIQKILKLLGASVSDVTTRYTVIINEDWSHTNGEVWRHEVYGKWRDNNKMLVAKNIIDKWLGGDGI